MTVSIVIPVLDDSVRLRRILQELQRGWSAPADVDSATERHKGPRRRAVPEIIVVDGGSRDDSVNVAKNSGALVLERCRNRGLQLDEGARTASGDWLWFLHADSGITADVLDEIGRLPQRAPGWGRFDVRLGDIPLLRLTAIAMNWRSAITGICTGDQGIFVHRELLLAAGGVPRQRLMEDIELSRRLRRLSRPVRIRTPINASARRWRSRGVLKTMLLMWWLRFRYLCGARPDELDRRYYG